MWIRSQNKMSMVEMKEEITMTNMVEKDWAIILNVGVKEKNKWLGVYKSKERALEVLDEIQMNIIDSNVTQYEYFYTKNQRLLEYTYPSKSVYQMPKE